MKKKIIYGHHNPYTLLETYKEIKEISSYAQIYLITTDHLLKKDNKKKILEWKKKGLIKDVIIFKRYFYNSGNLNILKILANYLMILPKLKKLSEEKIDLCIVGGNVSVWERIIIECIIKKDCKVVAYQSAMLTLPIKSIKELYRSVPINKIIQKIHKSRQLKYPKTKSKKKRPSFYNRIMSFINYKIYFFERKYIARLIFNKTFLYRRLDLNTFMDCDQPRINIILTHFETLQIYWKKLYPNVDVIKIERKNNCKCKINSVKKSILFLGDDIRYSEKIKKKISKHLKRDLSNILSELKSVKELHFRPHPGSILEDNEKTILEMDKNLSGKVKVKYMNNSEPLKNIACQYKAVVGSFGTGLFNSEQSCKKIIAIGLSSISQYYYEEDGKDCKIKVKGTNIGVIENDGSYKNSIFSRKQNIKNLLNLQQVIKKLLIN